jgi:hypothetical protein
MASEMEGGAVDNAVDLAGCESLRRQLPVRTARISGGKICRIASRKSSWQQGLVATCTDSSNEAMVEGEESWLVVAGLRAV